MTLISISVPVGAYHDLLPTCFRSLASQRENIRVSLLDASGDPRVVDLANAFETLFAYRRHGPDGGQSDAIIEGWRNTPGDVLGWLNADDFLYPGAIGKVVARFESDPSIDVVAGHSAICDAAGRMTGYHWAVAPPGENLRSGCVISQPSCFFRRDAYERAGGLDQALHYTMDWDLWLRLLDSGARFDFIDEPLSVVYWGEGTKTLGMKPARRRELDRIIVDHTPPELRFRARRGFLLRAFLDEIKPASLARFLESSLRRRVPYVFGVGPRGRFADRARLIWTHYEPQARSKLEIATEGSGGLSVSACEPEADIESANGGFLVTFRSPVEPAARVSLTLSREPGASRRLAHCAWL
ncbi:MAG: glycosyltransferase [Parvularculaceae bacterium]